MKVGYIRISKQEQHEDLQRDALITAKCDKLFMDKISGAVAERKGLEEALAFLRPGDTWGQHIPSCFLYAKRFQTGNGPCLCSPPLEGRHSRRAEHLLCGVQGKAPSRGTLPCLHRGA